MKVVDRKTVINNMGDTRTVQHYSTLLGEKAHKLGLVATLYPELAINVLTDALKNVYYNPKSASAQFTPINSMVVEWQIDVNYIKKVYIAEDNNTSDLGKNKAPFTLVLEEKYYDKNDTFTLEDRTQLFVVKPPRQKGPKKWEYTVILVGNNYDAFVSTASTKKGKYTRFRSNFFPELSERGFTKYMSNTEMHRNYMSRHRASESVSADYAIRESVYLEVAKKGNVEYYKMHQYEKDCLDTFMLAKNNAGIFSETNFDAQGKCLDQDAEGRDIPMSDGVIPQIERYCDKFTYNEFDEDLLDTVLASMVEKSHKPTGNEYVCVSNERLYTQFGKTRRKDYRFLAPNDASYMYSKETGGKVKVGAEFDSYTFQGNTITFIPDRALSQEFDQGGYAIFLDVTADVKTGRPGMATFTIEGNEMIEGRVLGLGGQDGKTSGSNIATGVHGSEYHLLGYSLAAVFCPYKSFILRESKL